MITHAQRTFDDHKIRPFSLTKRLIRNHFADELEIFIVYGTPAGIGKSSCVSYTLADVYGYLKCKDKSLIEVMWSLIGNLLSRAHCICLKMLLISA
jgi:hypothetical protein